MRYWDDEPAGPRVLISLRVDVTRNPRNCCGCRSSIDAENSHKPSSLLDSHWGDAVGLVGSPAVRAGLNVPGPALLLGRFTPRHPTAPSAR